MIAPDDWHCHLRDGAALSRTVVDQARYFSRSIVMPNLVPPVESVEQGEAYHQRILQYVPKGSDFTPLMTLYLTESMTAETIRAAKASERVYAIKLYPAGATTHSDAGVVDFQQIYPVLAVMEEVGLPLLVHCEVTDRDSDIFDRETLFVERHLAPMIEHFPKLSIVLEHITTQAAMQFVLSAPSQVAATITPHHLLLNRNDLLAGGIRPHHYCLPVLKRSDDQQALIEAAISSNPKFFLGTDSAPHALGEKQSACGCAGIYSAHAALELYAEVFDHYDALDRLEGFASVFGPQFYGLPINTHTLTLEQKSWTVPKTLPFGEQQLVPLRADGKVQWRVVTT
jgi:dihydroorotase